MKIENVTAIVLAGGKSSRMGIDKTLLPINRHPFIQHIVKQLEDCFDEIILSTTEDKQNNFSFLPVKIVTDEKTNIGPLMGIISSLNASSNDVNFITACDIPEIDINLIKKMLKHIENHDAVVPQYPNKYIEPIFAIYKKNVQREILKAIDSEIFKIRYVLNQINTFYLPLEKNDTLFNLNTRDQYHDYLKTLTAV